MKIPFKKTSNLLLFVSCTMIVLFTICSFLLQIFFNQEISSTLCTSFYAFWGAEVISLAAIKTSKVKYNYDNSESEEEIIGD